MLAEAANARARVARRASESPALRAASATARGHLGVRPGRLRRGEEDLRATARKEPRLPCRRCQAPDLIRDAQRLPRLRSSQTTEIRGQFLDCPPATFRPP